MERLAPAVKAAFVYAIAVHIHHRFRGPPLDYTAVALASAASWIGLPGPGESVLIAAGVLAAHHKLDLATVLVTAWAAATAGGIAGWMIGRHAGRAVVTAAGPLHTLRLHAVARGDDVFERAPVLAIVLTPSWVAGIHDVGAVMYLVTNALSAVLWAVGIGLAAYFLGPTVIDFVADLGLALGSALGLLIAALVAIEVVRVRRRRARRDQGR